MTSQQTCARCGQPIGSKSQTPVAQRGYLRRLKRVAEDLAVSTGVFLALGILPSRVLEQAHQARFQGRLTDLEIAQQLIVDVQAGYTDLASKNPSYEIEKHRNDGGIL